VKSRKSWADAFGERLQDGAHALRQIEQEHNRERQLVLAEIRDVLRNAVLEEPEVFALQAADGTSCFLVYNLGVHHHDVGSDLEYRIKRLRPSEARCSQKRGDCSAVGQVG
jgi:hypothetical protein